MKKTFEIFLKLFFYIIVGVFIFKILAPLYHSFIIRGDSLDCHWFREVSSMSIFMRSSHSWFLLSMFHFLGARPIPELLKIHPMIWYTEYYYWAMFGIMYLLQYSFVCNFTKYFKNKSYTVLWIFLTFPIFCGFLKSIDFTWIVTDDCWSYAYLFLPLFFIVFWSNIETLYVKNTMSYWNFSSKWRYQTVLFLLFLCIAVSSEFMRFIVCFSVLVGYILHCCLINRNLNHKKFLLSYVLIVAANIAIFFTDAFCLWFERRVISFSKIIEILPYYMNSYFKNVLIENRILLLLILVFMILVYWISTNSESCRNENKKLVIFSFSTLLSVLIFPLLTIVGQEYSHFTCTHGGILFMIKMYLLNILLSLCGYAVSSVRLNSLKFYILLLCFCPLLLNVKSISFDDEGIINANWETKKRIFMLERIFELYGAKEKVFLNCYDVEGGLIKRALSYFIYLYNPNSKYEDYKQIDMCSEKMPIAQCNKKLTDFLYEKTGYELTDEEIEKMDFQKYYRY